MGVRVRPGKADLDSRIADGKAMIEMLHLTELESVIMWVKGHGVNLSTAHLYLLDSNAQSKK